MVVTIAERAKRRLGQANDAVDALKNELRNYAREHGGAFVLFGSFAKGSQRPGSDVDLIVDFPAEAAGAAWLFAERACIDRGLSPDIAVSGETKQEFLAKAYASGERLS